MKKRSVNLNKSSVCMTFSAARVQPPTPASLTLPKSSMNFSRNLFPTWQETLRTSTQSTLCVKWMSIYRKCVTSLESWSKTLQTFSNTKMLQAKETTTPATQHFRGLRPCCKVESVILKRLESSDLEKLHWKPNLLIRSRYLRSVRLRLPRWMSFPRPKNKITNLSSNKRNLPWSLVWGSVTGTRSCVSLSTDRLPSWNSKQRKRASKRNNPF